MENGKGKKSSGNDLKNADFTNMENMSKICDGKTVKRTFLKLIHQIRHDRKC